METFTPPATRDRRSDTYLRRHFLYSKKYTDFSYKIRDSGLAVYAVLLDVRILDILEGIKQHFVEESEGLDVLSSR